MSPPIELKRSDIALHRLEEGKLRKALCQALELSAAREDPTPLPGVLRLGAWRPKPAASYPVCLLVCDGRKGPAELVANAIDRAANQSAMLITPAAAWPEECERLAAKAKSSLALLEDLIVVQGSEWTTTPAWKDHQRAFLAAAGIKLSGNLSTKRRRKRATRTADIEALKKQLIDEINARRAHLLNAVDREQRLDLPKRLTKATLGQLADVPAYSVTRCFQDSVELRRLYQMLKCPDDIMRFGTGQRR
jgi:hypothetical protein